MKEIISFPTGRTQKIIQKYLIHAHPHPRSYKEAEFITLRKKGGVMDALYNVQHEIVLRPKNENLNEQISHLKGNFQERLKGYIKERSNSFGFDEKEEYKFYLLDIEKYLDHLPRTATSTQAHTYFTLAELISGRQIVLRESEMNKK